MKKKLMMVLTAMALTGFVAGCDKIHKATTGDKSTTAETGDKSTTAEPAATQPAENDAPASGEANQ